MAGESPAIFFIMFGDRPDIVRPGEDHLGDPNIPWQSWLEMDMWNNYDWNYYNGGLFEQGAYPGRAQYSQWAQQMMATMYQNWYNSAPQAMQRAIEAGINPFVAASGIAGSDAGSVAPSPSSGNPSQLPNLLGSASQALGALGSSFGNFAQGISTAAKLRHEIGKIDAETQSLFENLGFTKLQSKALSVQLNYLDKKEQIGVWQALADYEKTRGEYYNLIATHRNILAQYDEIINHADLLAKQVGETQAHEALMKAQADKESELAKMAQLEREFFVAHGYKLGTPIYESLRDMMVNNKDFDLETYGNTISSYDGKVAGAVESAKLEAQNNYIYRIEYARQSGKNAADMMNGHVGSLADFANRIVNHGANLITGLGSKASDLFKSGKAKDIRKELTMILDNAYEQLEKFPEDSQRLNALISEIQSALYLSNSELVEWWKMSNK